MDNNFLNKGMDIFNSLIKPILDEVGKLGKPMSPLAAPTATPTPSPTITPTPTMSQGDMLRNQIAQSVREKGTSGLSQYLSPTAQPQQSPISTVAPTAIPQPSKVEARNPAISKFRITPAVSSALTTAANTFGLPPSILYDIALQESSFNPNLTNSTPAGVQAGNPKGLFQFTDGTWETVKNYANRPGSSLKLPNDNRFDPLTNALAAAYLIKNGQLGRWDASKNVWGSYYNDEELDPYYSQTLSHTRNHKQNE